MDTFFEHMVKRKKNTKDILMIVLAVLVAVIAIYLLTALYMVPLIATLVLPLQALMIFLCYKFITKYNVEFEYSVTNGDIEVDKIINKQKRKKVVSIDSKGINMIVPLGDDRIPQTDEGKIIDASSGNPEADIYCVIYGDGGRNILIFEPTEKIIEELKKRNPRKVFTKE